jgi:viologen exporter family transport system permease protein
MSAVTWRVTRVAPLGEINQPGSVTAATIRIATQLFLVVCLWRVLYGSVSIRGGLVRDQAVTYAALAVLGAQISALSQDVGRDSVMEHMRTGTILYWFLRPLSPRRYYFFRALGAQAYRLIWVLIGYLGCLAVGWVRPPASMTAGAVTAVSVLLAQVLIYQLTLTVDLLCFWTMQNESALMLIRFLQNLLSGGLVPLWFFPAWFLGASWFLPFRYTLDIPLSFYVGRLALTGAPTVLARQLAWCLLLTGLNRMVWRRAEKQVTVQGG